MSEELILYYREGCHLCDAMRKALHRFGGNHGPLSWQEVDIDRDTQLVRRFDVLVPVLCLGETEICHHFFDEAQLLSALADINPTTGSGQL